MGFIGLTSFINGDVHKNSRCCLGTVNPVYNEFEYSELLSISNDQILKKDVPYVKVLVIINS